MIWIGYAAMWLSVGGAVVAAILTTGSPLPLWALVIPALARVNTQGEKDKPKEDGEESQ